VRNWRRKTSSSEKQLACYIERQVRPRRTDNASRIALVLLSHFVDWRELLTIVRPIRSCGGIEISFASSGG
jgi:hypothetical protein